MLIADPHSRKELLMVRARLVLLAMSLVAAPVGAQQMNSPTPGVLLQAPTSTEQTATVTPVTRGPTMASATVAARVPQSAERPDVSALPSKAGLGQARALMIVGGAALLAGAIIGGDAGGIIMVGGAVVGLIGLYEYLQ